MQITAIARPNEDNGDRRELTATADNYDTAMAEINAAVPDGWILLHVQADLPRER